MGLRITTSILSLMAQRNLANTSRALAKTMQRLASGLRINSAADDPAGLAISTGLDSQRRGLLQAVRNLNDARGILETADGTLETQSQLVQRMRELAMQASNGTLSNSDRSYLNNETQQLLEEFNRLTNQTQFNSVNLLDGSFGTKSIQVGSQKGQGISFTLANMQASNVFTTSVTTSAVSGSGDGTFQARTTFIGNASGAASVLEDLNGDGNLDLIVANGFGAAGTISIHLGNGNGTFAAPTTYAAYHTPTSIAVSDLNSDGKLDLTIANYYSDVSVHLGNGNGTFQSRVPYTMGSNSDCVITQDFNLDGKLDMVTADYTSGTLSIRLGNGDGTFLGRTTVAVGAGATSVTARDLNGDGKLDLVSTDKTDATLSICIGNGDGTFAARTTAATGVNPLVVLSQDLNGDGSMDVIVADGGNTFGSSTLDIFIANGNGTFQARTTVRVGGWADSLAATDINGDGKIDLLCTEDNNQNISVVIGNGNGTFQARRTLATGVGPIGISLGDVNDDDIKDILVLNASDNTIGLYLGNGTASTSTSTSTEPTSIYLDTQADAQDALAVLDTALAYIYSARSNIGAIQSRLDFATSVNMNTIENISAARSQIMDADMASTTAEFARLQILQQAGIAVLGQANLSLQTSLKLLQNL